MIDFKKAFDSVSHEIHLRKLTAAGVSGDLEYITSYLSGRKTFTKVNDVTSQKTNIDFGVPQGSLLGPTGFTIIISDMPEVSDADEIEIEMFADVCCPTLLAAISMLQDIASKLFDYTSRNLLTIHPGKSQLMIAES